MFLQNLFQLQQAHPLLLPLLLLLLFQGLEPLIQLMLQYMLHLLLQLLEQALHKVFLTDSSREAKKLEELKTIAHTQQNDEQTLSPDKISASWELEFQIEQQKKILYADTRVVNLANK